MKGVAMTVTFDQATNDVLGYIERLISHRVPERVALNRAAKKYEWDRGYLRSLLRLQRESV